MEANRAEKTPNAGVEGALDESATRPVQPALRANETIIARRASASVRLAGEAGLSATARTGALYLTEQRLIIADADTEQALELSAIAELALTNDSLLVALSDGGGWAIEVETAGDLRTAIAIQLKLGQSPSR